MLGYGMPFEVSRVLTHYGWIQFANEYIYIYVLNQRVQSQSFLIAQMIIDRGPRSMIVCVIKKLWDRRRTFSECNIPCDSDVSIQRFLS